jgi:hypothetical protein
MTSGSLEGVITTSHLPAAQAAWLRLTVDDTGRRPSKPARPAAATRAPGTFIFSARPVRAENLNPDVLVMRPANEGVGHDASDLLNRA